MTDLTSQRATLHNFSEAFERMASFAAISQTANVMETLKALLLQCFVIFPEERLTTAEQIAHTVKVIFQLDISIEDITRALDMLITDNRLIRLPEGVLAVDRSIQADLAQRLQEANALEEKVRETWFEELAVNSPHLPAESIWRALTAYLAKAFQRHGLQTIAYLDPSVVVSDDHSSSLYVLLREAVVEIIDGDETLRNDAVQVVSSFMANVGKSPERAKYIAQLADGVFNYYSLTVAPEVSQQFRQNLEPLMLFLDTNYLFGILDLHVNQFVDVSQQILQITRDHHLPFQFRYHSATADEFLSSLRFYGDRLRARHWTSTFSRSASVSRNLSGIETKYHQRNAESPVDVNTFLNRYEHFDVELEQLHRVTKYTVQPNHRLEERADLTHAYNEFLERIGRDKSPMLVDHDIKLLDAVRELREQADSSIQASALALTCDHTLYRFDWELSKRNGRRVHVLMPNLFMQTLRPFVPSSPDFDKSFAETFALPEFRTIGSGAMKAASKLTGILASYQDLPEQTAMNLLSNDLLLDRLRVTEDDSEFLELVEAEIVAQNQNLIEEKANLERQLEAQKQEGDRISSAFDSLKYSLEDEQAAKDKALKLAEQLSQEKQEADQAYAEERKRREELEFEHRKARERIERYASIGSIVGSLVLGVIVFVALGMLEIVVQHPDQTEIRAASSIAVASLLLGYRRPKWRVALWGTCAASAISALLTAIL